MRQIILNMNSTDNYLYYKDLIRQGENLASELIINLIEEYREYKYIILFQNNKNEPIPSEEVFAVNNVITYPLPINVLVEAGVLSVELQCYADLTVTDKKIIKSATTRLNVVPSLSGELVIPEPYVPWLWAAVAQATIAKEQANIATNKAAEVTAKLDAINVTTWQSLLNI